MANDPKAQNLLQRLMAKFAKAPDTPPVSSQPAVKGEDDPWSARTMFSSFMEDWGDPDNPVLRRERSDDNAYNYPYGIFDEMFAKDTQITAAARLRRDAVLDGERTITPADDTPLAQEIADFVEFAIDHIGNSSGIDWSQVTSAFLDSVWYGFRVCELIWSAADWEDKAMWIIGEAMPRKHRRFMFDDDDKLQIVTGVGKHEDADPAKFAVVRLYPDDDNPYGDAMLSRIYHIFKFKKSVTVYWISYCEKYGQPLPVGELEQGAVQLSNDDLE